MRQRSLHEFFTSDCPYGTPASGTSFLSLPFPLRRRIYLYTGLIGSSAIYLNYLPQSHLCGTLFEDVRYDVRRIPVEWELSAKNTSLSHFLDGPIPCQDITLNRHCDCIDIKWPEQCKCDPFPFQLLYVSRAVSREVWSIFYSENHFNVCKTDSGGLSGLRRLGPKIITWLSSLSICLNRTESGCQEERHSLACSFLDCYPGCELPGRDKLLRKRFYRLKGSAMANWNQLCEYLSRYVVPNRLKLRIICDLIDIEEAKEIMASLSGIPVLEEFAIRLGPNPNDSLLSDLVMRTVLEKTGRSVDTLGKPFQFEKLPQEIQLRILEYTDLVTPYDLAWSPNKTRYGITLFEFRNLGDLFFEYYHRPREYIFECCQECCSDASEGCFCRMRHAAYSTSCKCWRLPTSILMVSRKMREDAISILFSKNHFVVLPAMREYPTTQLEILQFLDRLPYAALSYLRSITWILPDLRVGVSIERENTVYRDWLTVTKILSSKLSLPLVELTLDFLLKRVGHQSDQYFEEDEYPKLRRCNLAFEYARVLTQSLMPLDKFKGLYLHIIWPWQNGVPPEAIPDLLEKESALEMEVMGTQWNQNRAKADKYKRRHRWNGYYCGENCEECGTLQCDILS